MKTLRQRQVHCKNSSLCRTAQWHVGNSTELDKWNCSSPDRADLPRSLEWQRPARNWNPQRRSWQEPACVTHSNYSLRSAAVSWFTEKKKKWRWALGNSSKKSLTIEPSLCVSRFVSSGFVHVRTTKGKPVIKMSKRPSCFTFLIARRAWHDILCMSPEWKRRLWFSSFRLRSCTDSAFSFYTYLRAWPRVEWADCSHWSWRTSHQICFTSSSTPTII